MKKALKCSVLFLLMFAMLFSGCRKDEEPDELSFTAFTSIVQKKNLNISDTGARTGDMSKWKKAVDGKGMSVQYAEFWDASKAATFAAEQADQINLQTGRMGGVPVSGTYGSFYYYVNRFDTVVIVCVSPTDTVDVAQEICEKLEAVAKKGVAEPTEDSGNVEFFK